MYPMRYILSFFALLVVVSLVYWPGLSGPFTLDDFPNLEPLAYFGGVVDWPSLIYFVGSNESGPLGRPLSMASFLLNDHSWPSNPEGFKYTNLMIHLINGLLVYWCMLLVAKHYAPVRAKNEYRFALVVAALWVAHPMHVSTTLYVVQRMTLLSSTAILAGLVCYLSVRPRSHTWPREFLLLSALAVIGSLGLLFKETAALLIVYLFVLEVLFFGSRGKRPYWRIFPVLIPVMFTLFSGVIIFLAATSEASWAQKGFVWWQRLLTEAGILFEYLYKLILPKSHGGGVFQDGRAVERVVSVGSVAPIVGWFVLAVIAIRVPRFSWIKFPLFFFLGGHLLESTVIPLELYFEHRNYLPSIGVFVVFGVGVVMCRDWLGNFLIAGVMLLLLLVTANNVAIWSDEDLMRELWAMESPNSIRAQQNLIGHMVDTGDLESAGELMVQLNADHPGQHQLNLQAIIMACLLGEPIDSERYSQEFSRGDRSNGVYDGLLVLRRILLEGKCDQLSFDELGHWVEIFLEHPGYQDKNMKSFLYQELAVHQTIAGDLDGAIQMLDRAQEVDVENIMFTLTQAYWLADAGLFQDAREFIEKARNKKSRNPLKYPMQEKLIDKANREISAIEEAKQ